MKSSWWLRSTVLLAYCSRTVLAQSLTVDLSRVINCLPKPFKNRAEMMLVNDLESVGRLMGQWDDPGAKPALSRQVYLAERCEGDRVNLETDEFQKYLQQIADLVYTVYCVANAADRKACHQIVARIYGKSPRLMTQKRIHRLMDSQCKAMAQARNHPSRGLDGYHNDQRGHEERMVDLRTHQQCVWSLNNMRNHPTLRVYEAARVAEREQRKLVQASVDKQKEGAAGWDDGEVHSHSNPSRMKQAIEEHPSKQQSWMEGFPTFDGQAVLQSIKQSASSFRIMPHSGPGAKPLFKPVKPL